MDIQNKTISLFKAKTFYEFLDEYYSSYAEINNFEYELNSVKRKKEYNIFIDDKNINKKCYYYFIYTSYENNKQVRYTNKDIIQELFNKIIKSDYPRNRVKYYIVTLLEEEDIYEIERIFERELINRNSPNIEMKLNIEVLGKSYVQRIIQENKILFTNIISKEKSLDDLAYLINSIDRYDRQKYDNNNEKIFINNLKTNNFNIVLGAGVSVDCGANTWGQLLDSFSNELKNNNYINDVAGVCNIVGDSPLIKAQLFKDVLEFRRYKNKYYKILYNALYSKVGLYKYSNNNILYHIARIIYRNKESRNFKVISYNYDNFLEYFIDEEIEDDYVFEYVSLYKYNTFLKNKIPIYHVHGFLPFIEGKSVNNIAKKYKESIVLTEKDYNDLYNDPYRWEIAVQLLTYRESICLFVGSSLTDPNIRRLIKIANDDKKRVDSKHYALLKKPIKMSSLDYAVIEKHFLEIGVRIIWTDDYGASLLKKLY